MLPSYDDISGLIITEHPAHHQLELVEERRDIPEFQTEAEEAQYWATHTFGDHLVAEMKPAREVDPRLPAPRMPI